MPEPDWWTEAGKLADEISELIKERGAGEWLPVVACLLALKRALDEAEAQEEPGADLDRLNKAVAGSIQAFANLAGAN